jgi:SNF2 family DNA or RNA helicase
MTKNNPFAKYAANANSNVSNNESNDGWLSTKKRGRDDEQIALDSKKALDAKRKRKQITRRQGSNQPTSSLHRKIGKRNVTGKNIVKRSVDEEDSFIASEESEIEIEESDEEEEFVIESNPEDEEEEDEVEEVDEEEEEEEEEEDLDEFAKEEEEEEASDRDGLIGRRIKGTSTRTAVIGKESRHGMKKINRKKHKLASQTSVVNLNTSDDDDDDVAYFRASDNRKSFDDNNSPFSSRVIAKSYVLTELDTSCEHPTKSGMKNNTKRDGETSATVSKFFHHNDKMYDSDSKDLSSPQLVRVKRKSVKAVRSWLSDSDGEENVESNRVDMLQVHNKVCFSKKANRAEGLSDTDDDDAFHEAIALSNAIEESRKHEEERLMNVSKRSIHLSDNDDENANSDQDNDEDNIDETDEYVDEKEIEASNVLAAANNLCSHIVSTMATWFDNGGADISDSLIVDGAIALSTVNKQNVIGDNASSPSMTNNVQKWISQEEMKSVCPNISLKEYQLIGVNWLALLHSLTFELPDKNNNTVKNTRKKGGNGRNVNGVLADEMGLGKTAQTIAFLAWLKYGRCVRDNDQDIGIINVDDLDDSVEENYKPHLIVVPASVLENWQREFEKFCPSMNIIK